jgi:formylglycine-generating enzyme required for sulfatase activity
MQQIPAGRFKMGCEPSRDAVLGGCDNDEKPALDVNLRPFQISRTEITFAQWDACTDDGACIKAQDQGWGRGQQPVIYVSWRDVQVYIKWLNSKTGKRYQLPTEAQWAYAARAGGNSAFPWGNSIACNNANYGNYKNECRTDRAKPVASFAPNRFGLYDTTGNLWEWVQDCWTASLQGASNRGAARTSCKSRGKRVVRGGSWSNDSRIIRTASRHGYSETDRSRIIGFRLALTQ